MLFYFLSFGVAIVAIELVLVVFRVLNVGYGILVVIVEGFLSADLIGFAVASMFL